VTPTAELSTAPTETPCTAPTVEPTTSPAAPVAQFSVLQDKIGLNQSLINSGRRLLDSAIMSLDAQDVFIATIAEAVSAQLHTPSIFIRSR
jgi:hypothetical protein